MCPGSCAELLCKDCRKAAQEDKRGRFDAERRLDEITVERAAYEASIDATLRTLRLRIANQDAMCIEMKSRSEMAIAFFKRVRDRLGVDVHEAKRLLERFRA